MIGGLDDWQPGKAIYEPRLQKKLRVHSFRIPGTRGGIPSVTFPKYRVCPRCHSLRDDFDRGSNGQYRCFCQGEWGVETHPARLIAACNHGHIYEFPWVEWAHQKTGICQDPDMFLRSKGKDASALSDLNVGCRTCKVSRSLRGALQKDLLKEVMGECPGSRPWLGDFVQGCESNPRGLQKGATNVYFSNVESSLSIPKYANPVQDELNEHWPTLSLLIENGSFELIGPMLSGLFPGKSDIEKEKILEAIKVREASPVKQEDFLLEEWNTFTNPTEEKTNDFETRHTEIHNEMSHWFEQVVQVTRLREVRVLKGFSRVDYRQEGLDYQCSLSRSENLMWLPGVEIKGEGIFIRLRKETLEKWEIREEVKKRSDHLFQAYNGTRERLPRLILIHTLAHILMRELSLTSGYSSSSIRERLYVGSDMCGFLLYTGSADSDGSLGGLVQHGSKDRFYQLVYNALETARYCSSDPLCSDNIGGIYGKLNGAACYSCSLVSETSCEERNQLLDRGLVVNLFGQPETGYFS